MARREGKHASPGGSRMQRGRHGGGSRFCRRRRRAKPEMIRLVDAKKGAWVPVIDPLLGNAVQIVADNDRLQYPTDGPDRKHLVGPDLQDVVPDLGLSWPRCRAEPVFVKLPQPNRRGQIGGFTARPFGLVVLAPFRPFELLLAGWREFPRRGRRVGKTVFNPLVD